MRFQAGQRRRVGEWTHRMRMAYPKSRKGASARRRVWGNLPQHSLDCDGQSRRVSLPDPSAFVRGHSITAWRGCGQRPCPYCDGLRMNLPGQFACERRPIVELPETAWRAESRNVAPVTPRRLSLAPRANASDARRSRRCCPTAFPTSRRRSAPDFRALRRSSLASSLPGGMSPRTPLFAPSHQSSRQTW
jgi:hypothetical protein